MNVCFVYDRINKWGGAERVLQELHSLWPEAPLYTSVYNAQSAPWAKIFTIIPSFLQRISGITTHHEYAANLMPYAFESFDLTQFDVVISVTSAEAKGVITGPNQLHICYLLTPTRYLWSQTDAYASQYSGPGPAGWARKLGMRILRNWDRVAASRPDKYVAISQEVARRCKQYYHRPVDAVIYPPVDTHAFSTHPHACIHPQPGYLIAVSRLVSYKRLDIAIQACNQLNERLIIVGAGSDMSRLKRLAGPTIEFKSNITDDELNCLYHHAGAFLFPQVEEFGISAVEAQAAGLPVIAYDGGSSKEIIIPGKTGILFQKQTADSLVEAIQTWKNHTWYDKTSKEHAVQFDKKEFKQAFKQFVEDSWKQHLNQE